MHCGSLIDADDLQEVLWKFGLTEILAGVYALTRFHFVVLVTGDGRLAFAVKGGVCAVTHLRFDFVVMVRC